ncbi:MAG: hypothetical protein HFJ80_06525 [Clostridiales bacterium]|nr:hypothetical protein [Clostridiales bacterium]
MKTKKMCCVLLISLWLLMLAGCGMIDNLQNAEYHGGPFENNLESARACLLAQLQEKYGIEFSVVGKEKLNNYGPFHGATYSCEAAPVKNPEQVATALISQTDYQEVRDDYAVYYFKEEAEAPVLALCGTKDYVIDQRISLEMPGTEKTWTAEDGLERFLFESGAYVKLVLRFTDDLDAETYAEYLYDFLNSIDRLECHLLLQAKANKIYIFHEELPLLDGFDASRYSVENLKQGIETDLSMGAPQ